MVIRDGIFERHSVVFFPHSDIQLENGGERGNKIRTALEETEVIIPAFGPCAVRAIFTSFACETHEVPRCF